MRRFASRLATAGLTVVINTQVSFRLEDAELMQRRQRRRIERQLVSMIVAILCLLRCCCSFETVERQRPALGLICVSNTTIQFIRARAPNNARQAIERLSAHTENARLINYVVFVVVAVVVVVCICGAALLSSKINGYAPEFCDLLSAVSSLATHTHTHTYTHYTPSTTNTTHSIDKGRISHKITPKSVCANGEEKKNIIKR